MIRKTLLFLLLALVVVTVMDLWRGKDLPKGALPDTRWITLDAQHVDLVEQSYGEPVIVYFWGSWCPVCHVLTPSVDWVDNYLPVVSVAMSSGSAHQVQRYLQNNNYQLAVVNDPNAAISGQWGVPVTPAFAIVRNGEIHSFTAGVTTPLGLYARWLWAYAAG